MNYESEGMFKGGYSNTKAKDEDMNKSMEITVKKSR